MTLREIARWIAAAEPRQTRTYHRGFFAVDALLSADMRSSRNLLLMAEDKGLICLVQRKLSVAEFEYTMTRCRKPWPHSAEMLMLESAKRDMFRERAERG
jgi:hypothetical protein